MDNLMTINEIVNRNGGNHKYYRMYMYDSTNKRYNDDYINVVYLARNLWSVTENFEIEYDMTECKDVHDIVMALYEEISV